MLKRAERKTKSTTVQQVMNKQCASKSCLVQNRRNSVLMPLETGLGEALDRTNIRASYAQVGIISSRHADASKSEDAFVNSPTVRNSNHELAANRSDYLTAIWQTNPTAISNTKP